MKLNDALKMIVLLRDKECSNEAAQDVANYLAAYVITLHERAERAVEAKQIERQVSEISPSVLEAWKEEVRKHREARK